MCRSMIFLSTVNARSCLEFIIYIFRGIFHHRRIFECSCYIGIFRIHLFHYLKTFFISLQLLKYMKKNKNVFYYLNILFYSL